MRFPVSHVVTASFSFVEVVANGRGAHLPSLTCGVIQQTLGTGFTHHVAPRSEAQMR
jgi:hypothetical protein